MLVSDSGSSVSTTLRAISKLKPALRDTAVLVAGQQLSHAEAAAILNVAEATVSWRMHEVRRILSAAGEGDT